MYNSSRDNKKDKYSESFDKSKKQKDNNKRQYVSSEFKTKEPLKKTVNIEDVTQFPELSSKLNNTTVINECMNENTYNNILSNIIEPIVNNNLPSKGWIIITKNKITREIEREYTPSDYIKSKKIDTIDYDSPDYIMSKIVEIINNNREYYRREYDKINGYGSFDELHYSQSIYSHTDDF